MNDLRNQDSLRNRAARSNTLAYLQKTRGKPQYRPAPSAARAVNKVLRPLSKKFGPGVNSLRSHWPQIIGERWASLSQPVAIRRSKGAKTLLIKAKGPAAAMLQAQSAQLLDKINQFLGANAITKLTIKQGRISPAQTANPTPKELPKNNPKDYNVHETLAITDDNSLKAALDQLGKIIKSRENTK